MWYSEELVDAPGQVKQDAFQIFRDNVSSELSTGDGNTMTNVMISCYVNGRLYRYRGTVCLVSKGYFAGTVRVRDGEDGFVDENIFLADPRVKYALGRTSRVLIVENPASVNGMTRIDFEAH